MALDYAILVVSGSDGVQSHTQTLWKLLEEYQIPTFIFVNKMDQITADRQAVMDSLHTNLSSECIDFGLKAESPDVFWESVAMCDENLLETFLEEGILDEDVIAKLVAGRKLFPCFFGSALKDFGVDEFMDSLADYMLYPSYPQEFAATVIKITRDEQGARLTHVKILGGSLSVKQQLFEEGWEKEEKINQIRIYQGDKYELTETANAGWVVALTGLTQTKAGDGMGSLRLSSKPILTPVLSYRVNWPKEKDAAGVLSDLKVIEEENPEIMVAWDEELGELCVQLMGDVQIEVLKTIVLERFGYEIGFAEGKVVYQETINGLVEGVGHFEPLRHYAEVHLLMEPLPRGSGLEFKLGVSQDVLSLNWQRLIYEHLGERIHRGVLTGSPITDMRITVAGGRAHTKHTEGGDFRQATYRAIRQGLMQAESILLEPYFAFRIEVDRELIGRVMTDIEKMGGKSDTPNQTMDTATLSGVAPVATIRNYAKELAAFSKGRGRIFLQFAGYDKCHNTEEVIEQRRYNPLHDLRNTPDSVFCANGSGFVVSWDEVFDYMHVESVLKAKTQEFDEAYLMGLRERHESRNTKEKKFGQEDNDLMEIFEKTYGPIKDRSLQNRRVVRRARDYGETEYKTKKKKQVKKESYLLVDGYNIVFAWDELKELAKDNIDAARDKLKDIMCDYQAMIGSHLILVFDAYRVKGNIGQMQSYHNIDVVYTKEAETADQYIEKTAHAMGKDYDVTVATSDGLIQLIVFGDGCKLLSARMLKEDVDRVKQSLRTDYLSE